MGILLIGLGIRIFHYIYNRSLWMDEIYLASSFMHMSYSDLAVRMLDYDQKAPIGFLWCVKFCVDIFGKGEMALRLIPFISGVAALILFRNVCRYFLTPTGQILAFSIFAFAPAFIYHSVEIKQYSTECLASVFSLYLFTKFNDKTVLSKKIYWGITAACTVLFSFSIVFMLAGIASGKIILDLIKKNWKTLFLNLVPFSLWAIAFVLTYFLFISKHAESKWVVYWFKTYNNFMPLPPTNVAELKWFPSNFVKMMDYPLGMIWDFNHGADNVAEKILKLPVIPGILLFTGMLITFKRSYRNYRIMIFPILFMLLASGLYLYPLLERFWLFIAPVFIIYIAIGFEYFNYKINSKILSYTLFFLIVGAPLAQSAFYLAQPERFYKHKKSFEKEALLYINTNLKPNDTVYNYWNNAPGYSVYKKMLSLKYNAIEGKDFRKNSENIVTYNGHLQSDFRKFNGKKRVWLIYNTQFLTDIGDLIDTPTWYYKNNIGPDENLIKEMKKIGKPIQKLVYSDITIWLFELQRT